MINEMAVRFLNVPGPDAFGPVAVPPEARRVALTRPLAEVRTALLGRNPDRTMLQLRLGQLIPLAHAWLGAAAPEGFDTRIGYDPEWLGSRLAPTFGVRLAGAGLDGALVRGEPPAEAGSGVIEHAWSGSLSSEGVWSVRRTLPPGDLVVTALTADLDGARLTPAPLPGSDLEMLPIVGASGPVRVMATVRPALDLAALAAHVADLGPAARAALFQAPEAAGCATTWAYRFASGPERLAALVVAFVLAVARTDREG